LNIQVFKDLIKRSPTTDKSRYIFIVDNKEISEAIISVGYASILIVADSGQPFFDVGSFLREISLLNIAGTYITDYVFVPATSRKKTNDTLVEGLKVQQLDHKLDGWTLFRNKHYLGKYEKQAELEVLLAGYIESHEGTDTVEMDLRQFHKYSNNGSLIDVYDMSIVEHIMATVALFVFRGVPYIYENGVYEQDIDGTRLKARIQVLMFKQIIKSTIISRVYALLISQLEVQKSFNDLNAYPVHWINFKNGMYDVIEDKMHEHKPEYFSINQIPHALVPIEGMEGTRNHTRRFLESAISSADDRAMLFEYLGYCMTRDTRFQKFLMLTGDGGTGKSLIISLMQYIVGEPNCSSISLQDLNKRFYATELYCKLLNACADISAEALSDVATIKKAVGEDSLLYEKKTKDPSMFRSYAKLLFSANKLPLNLDEKSSAYYRRLMILEMNHIPAANEKDVELLEKLKKEIHYVIWLAIVHMRELYKRNKFTESGNSTRLVEKLRKSADSIRSYIDERIDERSKRDCRIERSILYEDYRDYCKEYGRKEYSARHFYEYLEEIGYQQIKSNSKRYFLNVMIKEDGWDDLEENNPFKKKQGRQGQV